MAVIFLLLAIGVGAAIGDAVYESTDPGTVTVLERTTDQFTEGQLVGISAGLGFLLALLLVLAASSTRGRRARRRELREATHDLEDRVAELEREGARLRNDLAQRDQALAEWDAALAQRDQLLAYQDGELARRDELLQRARQARPTNRPPQPVDTTTSDRPRHWREPEDAQATERMPPPRDRPVDPRRDDPTDPFRAGPEGPTRPLRRPGGTS